MDGYFALDSFVAHTVRVTQSLLLWETGYNELWMNLCLVQWNKEECTFGLLNSMTPRPQICPNFDPTSNGL